jgi:hypothetical protein
MADRGIENAILRLDKGPLWPACQVSPPTYAGPTPQDSALHLGVRTFVNLMEEDETNRAGEPFRPYAPDVREEAQRIGLGRVPACLRFPIRDLGVPSRGQLAEILQAIEDSLDGEEPVYVHCWGGRDRTGTVVGSLLIRHGHATREDFVEKISLLRKHDLGGGRSPETEEQISLVRGSAGYGR